MQRLIRDAHLANIEKDPFEAVPLLYHFKGLCSYHLSYKGTHYSGCARVAMFALESIAAGCAVLGGNIPEFSGRPRELPIIPTNPDNIYQTLRVLLENPELRRDLGEKGRKYVEKYHDSRKIADDVLRLLAGNTEGLTWYDPKAS